MTTINRIEQRFKRVIADIQRNVTPERLRELGLDELLILPGNGTSEDLEPSRDEIEQEMKRRGLL